MKDALGTVGSVLLLGGRSEIGLAIASRLVAGGAREVVLAVRGGGDGPVRGGGDAPVRGAAPKLGGSLREAGASVSTIDFDIADPGSHAGAIGAVFDRLGDVDVVVDAIGVLGSNEAYEGDPAGAAAGAVTNFAGHVSAGLVVAERLRAQGHGTLVVLSSAAGVRVRRANYVYGAAKAGLDGFALGLGDALLGSGAGVMVVRPGFVRTQMTRGMSGPLAVSADDVAAAVADGLRVDREVVWVPRVLGPAFGLARLVPRAIWRRLPL